MILSQRGNLKLASGTTKNRMVTNPALSEGAKEQQPSRLREQVIACSQNELLGRSCQVEDHNQGRG